MSYLLIFKIMVIIASIRCRRTAIYGLSTKHLTQTDTSVDLLNHSFHGNDLYEFHSQESQYYDPVIWNHSALLDYLDSRNVNANDGEDLGKLPALRKRSTRLNCTDLCERSLCPWTMHWNEDAARVPQFIRYAKCQTDYCNFSFAKLGAFELFKLGMGTQCETVTTDIFSIKEGKENWITGWPIACICTKDLSYEPLSKPVFSDPQRTKAEMTSSREADAPFQNYDSENEEYFLEENPTIYPGVEDRSLTNEQRERLLRQEKLKKQHSESFAEVMEREKRRTLITK